MHWINPEYIIRKLIIFIIGKSVAYNSVEIKCYSDATQSNAWENDELFPRWIDKINQKFIFSRLMIHHQIFITHQSIRRVFWWQYFLSPIFPGTEQQKHTLPFDYLSSTFCLWLKLNDFTFFFFSLKSTPFEFQFHFHSPLEITLHHISIISETA